MSPLRRFLLTVTALASAAFAVGPSATVSAHNTLESSSPADGATLEMAPGEIRFLFVNPVPLEMFSAEFVDATRVRTDLTGSRHGLLRDTEVVTPAVIFDLRRAMRVGMSIGAIVIGVTAATVVSPPATASDGAPPTTSDSAIAVTTEQERAADTG